MASSLLAVERRRETSSLPLVLLHAFPLDSRMYEPLLAELRDLDVLTIDAPGFGRSPAPAEVASAVGRSPDPSLETYADAVAATLATHGVQRAVVAGLSMGGYALLALAERHRGLLAGAGLLDTSAEPDSDEARANRLRMAEQAEQRGPEAVAGMADTVLGPTSHTERPGLVEKLRAWLAEVPGGAVAWAQRSMAARPQRMTALDDLTVPVLVLRGAEDALSDQGAAEEMVRRAGGDGELVIVPRAGHLSALEEPGVVAAALRALHERATAARPR